MAKFLNRPLYLGFEAQTGIVRRTAPRSPSNFYLYLVPARFENELEELAGRAPDLSAGDIEWLRDWDMSPNSGEFADGTYAVSH